MTTYEALEMSGYRGLVSDAGTERERVGSFVSITADDWREYNTSQEIDMYFVTGGLRAFAAGRLNYHFKWEGPSYTVDTACSSGAAASQLACASLLGRDCDMAVAGGPEGPRSSPDPISTLVFLVAASLPRREGPRLLTSRLTDTDEARQSGCLF